MKSINKKIAIAALAASMILTGAGSVFAGTGSGATVKKDRPAAAKKVTNFSTRRGSVMLDSQQPIVLNDGNAVADNTELTDKLSPGEIYVVNSGLSEYQYDYMIFWPVVPTKTGSLDVQMPMCGGYVTLVGGDKQLSGYRKLETNTGSDYAVTFGVQKGKLYYIAAFGNALENEGKYYQTFSFENDRYGDKFSTSRRSPKKLRNGKTYKGTILSGSKTQYFRYTKKGRRAKMCLTITTDNKVKATVTVKGAGKTKTESRVFPRGTYQWTNKAKRSRSGNITYTVSVKPVNYSSQLVGKSSGVFETYCK